MTLKKATINTITKKIFLVLSIILSTNAYSQTECVEPVIPIIPDGNIASKDEMLSASKALKNFQKNLIVYRKCLTDESIKITGEDEISKDSKVILLEKYNKSVDIEVLAADEFNTALRAFKKK